MVLLAYIMKFPFFLLIITLLAFSGCGIYKRSDIKDNPVNVEQRVKKNIEEGRGVRFGGGKKGSGGTFDFANSNPMWRATVEVLDFITFTNASYSGGIIITDWINTDTNSKEITDIKITVKFLSNEIRADGLEIDVHERLCNANITSSCQINKIKSEISSELKLAILKKATMIERNIIQKRIKENKTPTIVGRDRERKKSKN